eukprot:scaffold125939_cov32-Tisochrysis_lutea.AAC.1
MPYSRRSGSEPFRYARLDMFLGHGPQAVVSQPTSAAAAAPPAVPPPPPHWLRQVDVIRRQTRSGITVKLEGERWKTLDSLPSTSTPNRKRGEGGGGGERPD